MRRDGGSKVNSKLSLRLNGCLTWLITFLWTRGFCAVVILALPYSGSLHRRVVSLRRWDTTTLKAQSYMLRAFT